jgi:hypothetical protein
MPTFSTTARPSCNQNEQPWPVLPASDAARARAYTDSDDVHRRIPRYAGQGIQSDFSFTGAGVTKTDMLIE